ncbi:MAG: 50S ribosomal protein L1 [Dehalococcoidia bacterium]|nr:50S ribosomal protein L1 [Dehalococcoidia bacterium]
MPKNGKKYEQAAKLVDGSKLYPLQQAVGLVKKVSFSKFDGTVEAHIRLGIDPRQADQQVRSTVTLPAGTGRTVRVLAFAQGEKVAEAEEAGADYVGGEEYAKQIQDGWLDFDAVVATPDMMGQVGRLGRVLGPRGLMPSPRTGTVTFDLAQAISEIKGGRVEFRADRTGLLHVPVGKVSFSEEDLVSNLTTLMANVNSVRPSGAKGQFVRSITLAPTMGPGVRVDVGEAVESATAAG